MLQMIADLLQEDDEQEIVPEDQMDLEQTEGQFFQATPAEAETEAGEVVAGYSIFSFS